MGENTSKTPPKGNIRFSISLSAEQKAAKEQILNHAYSFVFGKAGSGKTLLAVQIALDMFFNRQYNKIVITRPTISTEDNGFLPGSQGRSALSNGHSSIPMCQFEYSSINLS